MAADNGKHNGNNDLPPDDPDFPFDSDGPMPSDEEFARAIMRALEDMAAHMLVLQDDDPEELIANLPRLLERLRAALALKGPHRARVIRAITRVDTVYWMASYRLKAWDHFLHFAISIARDMGENELLGEVLQKHGIYLALQQRARGAASALDWSREAWGEAVHQQVKRLVQLEQFNVEIMDMAFDEAVAHFHSLLAEFSEQDGYYHFGRIYHSMARYCRRNARLEDAFQYGQQALCYYRAESSPRWFLVVQLMSTLISAVSRSQTGSAVYGNALLNHLVRIAAQDDVNPWTQAKILHQRAVNRFEAGEYEQAKRDMLRTMVIYRRLSDVDGMARIRHLWGQAQRKLGQWSAARRHLRRAAQEYKELDNLYLFVLARLSYALVWAEQGEHDQALLLLERARTLAEEHIEDPVARQRMIDQIDTHIAEIRQARRAA